MDVFISCFLIFLRCLSLRCPDALARPLTRPQHPPHCRAARVCAWHRPSAAAIGCLQRCALARSLWLLLLRPLPSLCCPLRLLPKEQKSLSQEFAVPCYRRLGSTLMVSRSACNM